MQDEAFHRITADIITHPLFTQMQSFVHHGGENSLYDHSVDTAKCAYRLARKFHMREERVEAVTRAALLHDFFGYDWRSDAHKQFLRHYSGLRRLTHMHAFVHGAMAVSYTHLPRRADNCQPCPRWKGLYSAMMPATAMARLPLAYTHRPGKEFFRKNNEKTVV